MKTKTSQPPELVKVLNQKVFKVNEKNDKIEKDLNLEDIQSIHLIAMITREQLENVEGITAISETCIMFIDNIIMIAKKVIGRMGE